MIFWRDDKGVSKQFILRIAFGLGFCDSENVFDESCGSSTFTNQPWKHFNRSLS